MDLREMKFLIVDDMENIRFITQNILKQMGCSKIEMASDGKMAMNILKKESIDFIISDWNMPLMSGVELLEWVRNNKETKDTPFLMVTAEMNQENVLAAVQGGVSGYIVKPFAPITLMDKIKELSGK